MSEYLKHLFIRTPLERPLTKARDFWAAIERRRHPELIEIHLEGERVESLVKRVLQPDSNCIDIGAHLGSMLGLLLRVAPGGTHLAFEALPHKAEWLSRKFPEVTVHNVALSDTPGTLTFYQNLSHPGFSGLKKHDHAGDEFRELKVECMLLDDVVSSDLRVDFLKVDVEGAELSVLRGAEKLLREWRPITLFECTRSGLEQFGLQPRDVFDFWAERDYGIYLIKDYLSANPPLDLPALETATVYPFKAFNFVAAPRP